MKTCCKCKEVKPLESFSKLSRSKDGRQAKCKDCYAEYYRQNADKQRQAFRDWLANPENQARAKETREQYRQTQKYRESKKHHKAVRRAREYGTRSSSETITMSMITDLHGTSCLVPGCVRLDIEMDHVIPLSLGGTHTLDNLQPLCRTHNASKGNRSTADYRLVSI